MTETGVRTAIDMTSGAERILTWSPWRGLRITSYASARRLAVADSWLVRDGRVRGIERHAERFLESCVQAAAVRADHVRDFWGDMLAVLPREGDWFPRVELTASEPAELRVRLRPAPPLLSEVRVWVADRSDPRTEPRRKGPDLGVLGDLRREAGEHGAQEALLTTADGVVLEAAHSSILWWEENTLCLPTPTLPILPGVTAGLILGRVRRSRAQVAHRRHPTLDDLNGREVWLVNALHGIRPVTAWTGSPLTSTGAPLEAGPAPRAEVWRPWLDRLAEPLPPRPADHHRE